MTSSDFLAFLGTGRDNGLTTREIVQLTGISSRDIRKAVSELQHAGVPVINLQDGKGYYICNDQSELERYIKQEHSRGIANLARASALKKCFEQNEYFERLLV